jgi:hypothetical protein
VPDKERLQQKAKDDEDLPANRDFDIEIDWFVSHVAEGTKRFCNWSNSTPIATQLGCVDLGGLYHLRRESI